MDKYFYIHVTNPKAIGTAIAVPIVFFMHVC